MVSSRRLAREWALKILYEIDIGKPDATDAMEIALEHLRMDFVHRGSRTASGSLLEELALDWITRELRDTLPTLRLPFERAVSLFIGRLFDDGPYWQELRLERWVRSRVAGTPLPATRLTAPLPNAHFIPGDRDPLDTLSGRMESLTIDERVRFLTFARVARERMPKALEAEMRRTASSFAKRAAGDLAKLLTFEARVAELYTRWEQFGAADRERWRKVATMTQKQTGDWMRTGAFALKLSTGVLARRDSLDERIAALSEGWSLERQVAVDRNILRIATYEMMYMPGIPTGASINEAVELAKKYSTAESGRFVNGLLGTMAAGLGERPDLDDSAIESEPDIEALDIPDLVEEEIEESIAP